MYRKRKIIGIILLINVLFICVACKQNETHKKNVDNVRFEKKDVQEYLKSRTAYLEKEDGWVYYLQEEKVFGKDDKTKEHYFLIDAINMKYNYLDEFTAPIIEGNKIIGQVKGTPFFSLNEYYLKELNIINKFLLNSHLDINNAKLSDLDGLNVSIIDKNDILRLINKLAKETFRSNTENDLSKYANLPESGTEEGKAKTGEKIQVRYVTGLAGFRLFHCEIIDSSGAYLSDQLESGRASKQERQRQKWLSEIEELVIKKQTLNLSQYFSTKKDTCIDCVLAILTRLEEKADSADN